MNKFALKIFNADVAVTLEKFPELQLKSVSEKHYLVGIYRVIDNLGVTLEEYEIEIAIPKNYPHGFPELKEISKKIPRHIDRHIDGQGNTCVEIEQKVILISKKGISLTDFIEKYVNRYFCWQLRYDAGDLYGLEEWAHYEKGTLQFYRISLGIEDLDIIIKIVRLMLENNLPERNDPCRCNSGKRYKNCHLELIRKIHDLGKPQFSRDLIALEKLNVV